jgi:hypothetical protein
MFMPNNKVVNKGANLSELLVSLGIFSIILLSIVYLFSSGSGIWSRGTSKVDLLANKRIARMAIKDIKDELLQITSSGVKIAGRTELSFQIMTQEKGIHPTVHYRYSQGTLQKAKFLDAAVLPEFSNIMYGLKDFQLIYYNSEGKELEFNKDGYLFYPDKVHLIFIKLIMEDETVFDSKVALRRY